MLLIELLMHKSMQNDIIDGESETRNVFIAAVQPNRLPHSRAIRSRYLSIYANAGYN